MPATQSRLPLAGLNVLVVEDNFVLADSMRFALESFGCGVVGPAANSARALELIASHDVDIAILDVDLFGKSSAPVAKELERRGCPYFFLTGYENTARLPSHLHSVRCMRKPVDPEHLTATLLEELN